MADDVLRLRATVVSEQALAEIRKIGREIGLMPARATPAAKGLTQTFNQLGASVKKLGSELTTVVPALGGLGLGAASAGLAAAALMRTFTDVSKRVVELKYASKELGMSERDIRAWGNAAEKVGISSQSMTQGLTAFKKTMDGLQYNIGGARDALYSMGAGPIVQRMQSAATQADKLKIAFKFKDELMKDDPSGFKARMFFDQIELGADKARLSYEQFAASQGKLKERTKEEQKAAEDYQASLVDLGASWDDFVTKTGVKLFPFLSTELDKAARDFGNFVKDVETFYARLQKMREGGAEGKAAANEMLGSQPFGSTFDFLNMTPGEAFGKLSAPGSFSPGIGSLLPDWMTGGAAAGPGRAAGGPVFGGMRYTVGEKGPEQFIPGASGAIAAGGGRDEQVRTIRQGVFDALVDFQSYVDSSAGGEGGGGRAIRASFGGSAGAAAGGGVGGGGAAGPGGGGGAGGGGSGGPEGSIGAGQTTGRVPGGPMSGGPGGNAQLNDEGGKPIDQGTMKQAEALGRSGDTQGLQKLFAQKGYRMSGPACGIVASAYVKSAGFKPPKGGAIASNWGDWGQGTSKEDINKAGRPFGSMIGTYTERRYGGNVGAPLGKGQTGGHVMNVVPGTYDPKTNTAMFADQYGVRRRSIKNMALRYAGDEAVKAAAERRGEKATVAGDGSQTPSNSISADNNANVNPRMARAGPDGMRPAGVGTQGTPSGASLEGGEMKGGGADYLRQERKPLTDELENDPALKKRLAALASLEHESDPTAVVESLYNRTTAINKERAKRGLPPKSLRDMIYGGKGKSFYGPVRKGLIEPRLRELERDPKRMAALAAGVDAAASSNLVEGATDQGSGSDPNVGHAGGRITRHGETYNDFGGGYGHAANRRFREEQQARIAETERTKRIDRATDTAANGAPKAEGSVRVQIESNGTAAKSKASTDGSLFQKTTIDNYKQMQPTSKPSQTIDEPVNI